MDKKPTTLLEAVRYFSDAETSFEFVKQLRWPTGQIACPRCGCLEHSFLTTRKLWKCKACKRQFSIKVGTIFEDSPIGFDKWLPAMWLICNSKNSISSYEVARALGITQKTAWFMLHRIRLAMEAKTFDMMSGVVEVDETFVGGKLNNVHASIRKNGKMGKAAPGYKSVVHGARQREGGTVRAEVLPYVDKRLIQTNLRNWIEYGSAIYSDESKLYWGIDTFYAHKTVNHSTGNYVSGDVWTNGIENFWSLLKRAIKGTQVHVSHNHLPRYVVERTFAYNYRAGDDLSRMQIAVSGVSGRRITYAQLKAKVS